jgi:hypothetical protein
MPSWLTDVLGPSPAPRVVSVTRNSGTGGSSIPGLDIPALLKALQGQNDSANKDGMAQYENLLKTVGGVQSDVLGMGGLYDQAAGAMDSMGNSARRRITEGTTQKKAQASQDLVSKGLFNTTIGSSVNRGIDSDAERSMQDVDEQVSGARAGLLTQKAGATMNIGSLMADSILSRRNQGPDMGLYANLLQALTSAGGGSGSPFGSGGSGISSSTPAPRDPWAPVGSGDYQGNSGVQTFTNDKPSPGVARVVPAANTLPVNDSPLIGTQLVERRGLIYDVRGGPPVARRSTHRG